MRRERKSLLADRDEALAEIERIADELGSARSEAAQRGDEDAEVQRELEEALAKAVADVDRLAALEAAAQR